MVNLREDHLGLSDEAYQCERNAMIYEHEAFVKIEEAMQLLRMASVNSTIKGPSIDRLMLAIDDTMHDYGINRQEWMELLMDARGL